MGVRTRGLDIKAGAAKLKANRATRREAKLVIDRWNRRPGHRSRFAVVSAALLARHPFCLGHTPRSGGALRAARQFPLGSRIGVCFVWLLAAHFEKMS
jgi:hypothetical protein